LGLGDHSTISNVGLSPERQLITATNARRRVDHVFAVSARAIISMSLPHVLSWNTVKDKVQYPSPGLRLVSHSFIAHCQAKD